MKRHCKSLDEVVHYIYFHSWKSWDLFFRIQLYWNTFSRRLPHRPYPLQPIPYNEVHILKSGVKLPQSLKKDISIIDKWLKSNLSKKDYIAVLKSLQVAGANIFQKRVKIVDPLLDSKKFANESSKRLLDSLIELRSSISDCRESNLIKRASSTNKNNVLEKLYSAFLDVDHRFESKLDKYIAGVNDLRGAIGNTTITIKTKESPEIGHEEKAIIGLVFELKKLFENKKGFSQICRSFQHPIEDISGSGKVPQGPIAFSCLLTSQFLMLITKNSTSYNLGRVEGRYKKYKASRWFKSLTLDYADFESDKVEQCYDHKDFDWVRGEIVLQLKSKDGILKEMAKSHPLDNQKLKVLRDTYSKLCHRDAEKQWNDNLGPTDMVKIIKLGFKYNQEPKESILE